MRYYLVLARTVDAYRAEQHREAHMSYQTELRERGVVRAHGRLASGWGGAAVYLADSEADVRRYVEADPFIIEGIRQFEILEWDVKFAQGAALAGGEGRP